LRSSAAEAKAKRTYKAAQHVARVKNKTKTPCGRNTGGSIIRRRYYSSRGAGGLAVLSGRGESEANLKQDTSLG